MRNIQMTYRIETPDSHALAAKIASDQSTGTFVACPAKPRAEGRGSPPAFSQSGDCRNSDYPSIPQARAAGAVSPRDADYRISPRCRRHRSSALMTIAIGGVYSIKGLTGIRVVDMELPEEFARAHPGPAIRHRRQPRR